MSAPTFCLPFHLILIIFVSNSVICEESFAARSPSGSGDCTAECIRRISTSKVDGGEQSCARGCRFFTLATLIGDREVEGKSIKNEACKAMCQESYAESPFDLTSCKIGCDSTPTFSWSWFLDGGSMQISGDVEPDEILTDPSLRSQIARVETMRIPEIRLRTMPVVEKVPSGLCGGGTVRGIPYCLVWSLLLLLTLLGLWSCLSLEENVDLARNDAPPLPEKIPLV